MDRIITRHTQLRLVIPGPDADVMVTTARWEKMSARRVESGADPREVGPDYTALKRQRGKAEWLKRRLSDHEKESLRDVDYGCTLRPSCWS